LYVHKEEKETALPPLEEGMPLKLKDINSNQHFTQPPPRYTEASLIKALEEYGIGRPSTYAPTISTIISREYVVRESKVLKPTELGEITNSLMKERFPNIVNLKFTAQMESNLDSVESGKVEWTSILDNFYSDFDVTLQKAKSDMQGMRLELKENQTDIICENCGRNMVVKRGRFGKFIACPGYPECTNKKSLLRQTGAKCPKCGGNAVERRGKKGRLFYGCESFPKCRFISWDEPLNEVCPKCKAQLYRKKSAKPIKTYCKTDGCGYETAESENVERNKNGDTKTK
jgi:DNA topoisomerase-1